MQKYDALGYYTVLEVHPEADAAVIKRQYYQKAKYWHPDHNTRPEAQDMFQTTSVAYGVLQNPHERLIYDLLCCVYDAKDFPQMGSLKIYKNQAGKDDKALRVLKQRRCLPKGVRETKDICNIREAADMVFATAINNWLKGWWYKNGFSQTLNALQYNMRTTAADDADNLKLLIHNAVSYEQENNQEMAWIYAKQAALLSVADEHTQKYLNKFIEQLDFHPDKKVVLPYWNADKLNKLQLFLPMLVFWSVLLTVIGIFIYSGILNNTAEEHNDYYEVRRFGNYLVPSDMVESRIMKTDSDAYSKDYIFHLVGDAVIYYGPDTRYSPLRHCREQETVRITGYTADKKWYQIILDDGIIGYVYKNSLAKGFGAPVAENSYVYKEPKWD